MGLPPAKLFPLTSKAAWAFTGLSLNINGLNHLRMAMYERLLSKYQLVTFKKTLFDKSDAIQTNKHFIFAADSGARCFWSDATSPVFNERHGVDLVLSSAASFQDVQDLTSSVCTSQLKSRYLLYQTKLDGVRIYIHVLCATDEPSTRG